LVTPVYIFRDRLETMYTKYVRDLARQA
jgi:hypothetical protein